MAITLGSQFSLQTTLPLDDRVVVADVTARNALLAGVRFRGLVVYAIAENKSYQLQAGIANGDWVEFGSGGSGGGGLGPVNYFEGPNGNSPERGLLGSIETLSFARSLVVTQEIYCVLTVPLTYVTGTPMNLKVGVINISTSNTILLRAQATLVRPTDDYDSVTNQRTTTNAAITMTGSTDKTVQTVTLDIASSTGQINAVNLVAGSKILVRIYRDTDTSDDSIHLVIGGEEVTYV